MILDLNGNSLRDKVEEIRINKDLSLMKSIDSVELVSEAYGEVSIGLEEVGDIIKALQLAVKVGMFEEDDSGE